MPEKLACVCVAQRIVHAGRAPRGAAAIAGRQASGLKVFPATRPHRLTPAKPQHRQPDEDHHQANVKAFSLSTLGLIHRLKDGHNSKDHQGGSNDRH
jgi:hypothetical protein